MIYTPLTMKAMKIAYDAHHGQVDKSGVPYIFHPCHLAEEMTDEVSTCVALLHDVAEDTDVTLEQLAQEFPAEVIEALSYLTHEEGTDYHDYVRALRVNPVARAVKLADLRHNSDETRLSGSPEQIAKGRDYFRKKYSKAFEILAEAYTEEIWEE